MSVSVENTPCDEVFALYLMEFADRVKPEGYHLLARFIQNLRKCLNLKGWEIDPAADFVTGQGCYCEGHSAACLPNVANYFLARYLPQKCPQFEREKAADVMMHFNEWLYSHRYSSLKLSLKGNE